MNTNTSITGYFGAAAIVALANTKTGMVGSRLMTRAEFRKAGGLGRAEAGRKHAEYLIANCPNSAKSVSAMIAAQEIMITGIKEYGTGKGQISYMRTDRLDLGKAIDPIAKMSDDDLLLELANRKAAKDAALAAEAAKVAAITAALAGN